MSTAIHCGDSLAVLSTLPAESVDCCITSPPYFGLRDYGVPGQVGLEPTVQEYVARLVAVMREVRRVLRPHGTLWLNLGDSFSSGRVGRDDGDEESLRRRGQEYGTGQGKYGRQGESGAHRRSKSPKQLLGIPWRVAFALQDDGWILRSDIIWAKPNPMPESVRDRPTRAHEFVFLFAKEPKYFYDHEASKEPSVGEAPVSRMKLHDGLKQSKLQSLAASTLGTPADMRRNPRSVWTIAPKPFKGAHFAVFPEALVERCLKASVSERGICPRCGVPWTRVVERTSMVVERGPSAEARAGEDFTGSTKRTSCNGTMTKPPTSRTTGWVSNCEHLNNPVAMTVLDPFAGSGTVGVVAKRMFADFIGIDLNPEYCAMARKRIEAS